MKSYLILSAVVAILASAEQRLLADDDTMSMEMQRWQRCRTETRSDCGEPPALSDEEKRPPNLDCYKYYDDPRCNLKNHKVGQAGDGGPSLIDQTMSLFGLADSAMSAKTSAAAMAAITVALSF